MGAHEEAQGSRRVGASDEGHEGYESHESNEEGHEGYESHESNEEGHEGYEGRESDESYESHEGDEGNEEVRACSCEHGVRCGQRSGCGIWAVSLRGLYGVRSIEGVLSFR